MIHQLVNSTEGLVFGTQHMKTITTMMKDDVYHDRSKDSDCGRWLDWRLNDRRRDDDELRSRRIDEESQ